MANTSAGFPNIGPQVAAARHPIYDLLQPEWIKLGDVREGVGGFKTGDYLVGHPREYKDHSAETPVIPSKKFKARKALARYENLAAAILETKKSALFREQPNRRIGEPTPGEDAEPTELEQWWEDVDGNGTSIDDAMPAWWDLAATFGHVCLYFELPDMPAPAEGETVTAADQDWPYVRLYTPLDVLNWLSDENGKITAIKVIEAVPPTTFADQNRTKYQVRIITETGWELYDAKSGKAVKRGEHKLGRLPVVWLFGKRRAILSDVGQSVLGDPRNYIDLFNLTSEMRELERNQTFSFINLPLGTGADAVGVESAQALLGQQTGTMNVLFSAQPATILTADAANLESYREDIQQLKRAIYREAGVQWETDSKDAEAEGSLSLKREEMNTRLAAYADECQQAEYLLAELWYRWRYGADRGKDRMDEDEVTIHYPEQFTATPFQDLIDQITAAQNIGMPPSVLKELRKNILTKFEGMSNLMPSRLKELLDDIDNMPDDPTPQERLKQKMDITNQALKLGVKPPAAATKDEKAA